MAVIISDMDFPKRCLDCKLLGREKMYCQLHPRKDLNVIRVVSEKPEWCPLKPLETNSDKYVAVDDIIKRYMFHAEEKAGHEISQILHEVRKYSADEITATKREKEKEREVEKDS